MKRYKQKIVIILISFGIYGCSPYSYVRTAPPTPMFEKKGELQVNLYPSFTHVETQAAYAITDHFGVNLGAFGGFAGAYAFDLSAFGFRSIFNKYGGANRYFISCGVGIASGYAHNSTLGYDFLLGGSNTKESVSADYVSSSVNFSAYHIITRDHYKKIKLGFAVKANYLYYSDISYSIYHDIPDSDNKAYSAGYSGENKSVVITDLYFLSSLPMGKWFSFLLQIGYSIPFSSNIGNSYGSIDFGWLYHGTKDIPPPQPLIFQQAILNFGLQFHLHGKLDIEKTIW